MKRMLRTMICALAVAGGLTACDNGGGGNDNNDNSANTNNTSAAANDDGISLTGNWVFKQEVMELAHHGLSLQGNVKVNGFVNDAANPVQYPVPVVGSISADGATVNITEILHYPNHPAGDYRIEKTGTLSADGNTLTLAVISGQTPQTQVWTRAL